MPMSEALEPTVYNITLTTADTEYKQSLPPGTKHWSLQLRTSAVMRYAFATGRVATPTAPYMTIKADQWYNSPEKMSVRPWDDLGVAAVAEVNTITIGGTWLATETATVTLNGRTIVVTIGSGVTLAEVATTIKQAWNGEDLTDATASVVPAGGGKALLDHSQLTATVSGAVVSLTGKAGVRWNANSALAVTETSSSGTAVLANATAAAGPNAMVYMASPDGSVVAELVAWRNPASP